MGGGCGRVENVKERMKEIIDFFDGKIQVRRDSLYLW